MGPRTAVVDGASGLAELTARRAIEFANVLASPMAVCWMRQSKIIQIVATQAQKRGAECLFGSTKKVEARITPSSALATKYASLHWMPQSTVKFKPALPHDAGARGRWVGGIHKYIFVLRDDDRRHVQNWCPLLPNPGIAEDLCIGRHESDVLNRQIAYVDRHQHIIVRQQLWRQIEMNTNL